MAPMINTSRAYAQAMALARYYLSLKPVHRVWLFGGVARTGDSQHDIDMILGVEHELFYSFIDQLNQCVANANSFDGPSNPFVDWRREITERVLGESVLPPVPEVIDFYLDIFLFPADWEDSSDKIIGLTLSLQKRFVENIAMDARLFDKASDDFLPPIGRRL